MRRGSFASTQSGRQDNLATGRSDDGGSSSNSCFICATHDPSHWAVGPCGHPYCAICAVRLRALLLTKACPMCKSDHQTIYICRAASHENIKYAATDIVDQTLGIGFDSHPTKKHIVSWLAMTCPLCKIVLPTKPSLRHHVESVHHQLLCDQCLSDKPVFSFEQHLFPNALKLALHANSERGHPVCAVCPNSRRFYSSDELAVHIRECHEQCHLCLKRNKGDVYFRNYADLAKHFEDSHFACTDPLCLELKFVVFESQLEYKAHVQQVHLAGQKMQRSQQRMAGRIDLAFDVGAASSGAGPDAGSGGTRFKERGRAVRARERSDPRPEDTVQSVDTSSFWFPAPQLAGHLQSLSELSQKNKDVEQYLAGRLRDANLVKRLREECVKVSNKLISCRSFVHWISISLNWTFDDTKALLSKMAELITDRMLQLDMQRALDEYVKMQEAFPALPTRNSPAAHYNRQRDDKGKESIIIDRPITGRILAGGGSSRSVGMPSRNPLLLTGRIGPTSSNTANKRPQNPALPKHQEREAPDLSKLTLQDADAKEDSDSVFTIGAPEAKGQQQPVGRSADNKSKRKKGSVLLRFGGFSNPVNNT